MKGQRYWVSQYGFTLIELLVVLFIILIIFVMLGLGGWVAFHFIHKFW